MKTARWTAVLSFAALVMSVGCAADTSRDYEPFDRARGLSVVDLPPRMGDPDSPTPVRDGGLRLAQGLTLEEAFQIALEVNPNLVAAGESVNIAKANIWQESLFTNPVFSFSSGTIPFQGPVNSPYPASSGPTSLYTPLVGGLFNDSLNGSPVTRPRAFDYRNGISSYGITKDFDVSGKRLARVDNAIETERQTEAQYASAALQMKAQVRTAYASVLVAERNLELSKEAFEMAQKNFEIVGLRALGRKALPGDSLRAESDAERARIDLTQAERDVSRAKRALATLLGSPSAQVGPLRNELPLSTLPSDVEPSPLLAEALDHNADVIAARRAVSAAEANLRLQKRSAIPDLTLGAQFSFDWVDPASPQLDQSWYAQLTLSVPLPFFDQNRAQMAAALGGLHQAEAQERALEDAVTQQVRDDLLLVRTSQVRIESFTKTILPKARETVTLTEAGYEGGKILYLDVISARQNFNQQRTDYVTELLNYETALADLERLLARSLEKKSP